MNTDRFLKFIGWAVLTFTWLHNNLLFFGEIANAIDEHNEHIRKKAVREYKESLIIRQAIEEYNESLISDDEDESELE